MTDNGPALTQAEFESIGKNFYTTKSDGLGLGIQLVRSMAESHGGALILERSDGGGLKAQLPRLIQPTQEALCLLARHGDYFAADVEPLYVRPCDAVENLPELSRRQGLDGAATLAELERLLHLPPQSEC